MIARLHSDDAGYLIALIASGLAAIIWTLGPLIWGGYLEPWGVFATLVFIAVAVSWWVRVTRRAIADRETHRATHENLED